MDRREARWPVGISAALAASRLRAPSGRLATILGAQRDLTPAYLENQTPSGVFLTRGLKRRDEMATLLERGRVTAPLDDVRPLEDTAAPRAPRFRTRSRQGRLADV